MIPLISAAVTLSMGALFLYWLRKVKNQTNGVIIREPLAPGPSLIIDSRLKCPLCKSHGLVVNKETDTDGKWAALPRRCIKNRYKFGRRKLEHNRENN